ncbi:hypothetical protein E5D57_008303 [Metarhizium anisopliae]|nr:hypothetical protein E5D57_008303 [Metarhizium anisopliae]
MTSVGKEPTKDPNSPCGLLAANAISFDSASGSATYNKAFYDFGKCKVLLLGDASHGTSEFYTARAELSKYMIEHHGFNIIAIEGDWPDAEVVDRYVRWRVPPDKGISLTAVGKTKDAREAPFMRFPTWMWRNSEVQEFVEWLRKYNTSQGKSVHESVGFYGLDLYSLRSSMQAVIDYLDKVDGDMAELARHRYEQLMVWADDPHDYGVAALATGFQGHEKEVISMLQDLLKKRVQYSSVHLDGDEFHSAEQNARVAADAERYYKTMYYGLNESWNLRDTHMANTLGRILKHRGVKSKAIVWAHNSHVGDARATSMGASRREINIGQLCKETYGQSCLSIGCGTYTGSVAAASTWGGDMRVVKVQPALPGSYEELMHATGIESFALDLRRGKCDGALRRELMKPRLERFIGVIYKPRTERQSHYSSAILPEQFDGFLWFDSSSPVRGIETQQPEEPLEYDETWPFGL